MPQAGFTRHVGEGAITVIVQQYVVSPESDEQVDESIVVVISGADPLPPANQADSSLLGDVGERSVVVVAVEMTGRFLSLEKAFQPAAVNHENVRPAVVVEVESGHAAARGFDNVALGLVATVFGFGSQAGVLRNVDKVNFGRQELRREWRRVFLNLRSRSCGYGMLLSGY